MFSEFQKCYLTFQQFRVSDPLFETLRLFNILSGGALDHTDANFSDLEGIDLQQIAQQRKEGIPMEYIIGTATFAGLCFHCSKDTLIPTEWTKSLIEVALDLIKQRQQLEKKQTVVDLGTGCGNIAVLLALHTDNVTILATDTSAQAIDIARKNITKFNVGHKVSLFYGDLFSPLCDSGYKDKIDLIVCNPPYIPTASLNNLHPEIINHQPIIALDAGPYGIDFYRRLITDSIFMLRPEGQIAFEIGVGQEDIVKRLLTRNANYKNIRFHKDGNGQHRVVSAIKKQ